MNWLNYHHLYYFSKIAELGSVSAAAKELRLGQPTLSAQLRSLEAQLGELFERRNRRLLLNDRGRVVQRYAKDIFSRGDELLRVVERGHLAAQQQFVLGAQEGVPKAIIAAAVIRLAKLTGARIILREGDASPLLQWAEKGQVDFLVTDHQFALAGGISYLPVAEESIAIWSAASPGSKLRGKFPQNLDGQDFIMPGAAHPLRMKLDNFFLQQGIVPNVTCEIPDTALVKELGVQGLGLIALGEKTVRSWVRAGRLQLVGRLPFEMTYWLGIPKRALHDPVVESVQREFKSKR